MSNIFKRPQYPIVPITGEVPKYLMRDEVHKILDSIKKPRDHLIVNFLWNTGTRVSEMITTKLSDVDFYIGVINVRTLKKRGAKAKNIHRAIPVPKNFLNEIEDYANSIHLSPVDRIFPVTRQDIYYLVFRYCRRVGIDKEKSHPHTFRHSFAMNCGLQGAAPGIIAKWMGHADISTIMIYMNALARDTKAIRDELEF